MKRVFAVLIVWLSASTSLFGCAVPVFRYALERWPADYYEVVVESSRPLTVEESSLFDFLASNEKDRTPIVNYRLVSKVETIDSSNGNEQTRMTVYPPSAVEAGKPVWTGPFDRRSVESLLDSPARKELVRRLAEGDSAVWLFLPSGDPEKDEKALAILEKELKALKTTLELPEDPMVSTWNEEDLAEGTSLDISFSVVKVDRSDKAEEFLVDTLLRVEPDLPTLRNEPMAFPVYGRGRVLYTLVGKGINADTIKEACSFITGPCSCQIKELNPGLDLLIRANWEKMIDESLTGTDIVPPLVGMETIAGAVKVPTGEKATNGIPEDDLSGLPQLTASGPVTEASAIPFKSSFPRSPGLLPSSSNPVSRNMLLTLVCITVFVTIGVMRRAVGKSKRHL